MLLPLKEKKVKHSSKREEATAVAKCLPIGNYQVGKSKIFFKSPRAVSFIFLIILLILLIL